MKLLGVISTLFALAGVITAVPSSQDAQGISVRNDIDARGIVLLHPRDCNPPCTGCLRCAWCDYGQPCCKRLSPHCGAEASTDAVDDVAVTEKRAPVDTALSIFEPESACNPPCGYCEKCFRCEGDKPCCKRFPPICRNDALVADRRAAVDQAMSRRETKLLHPRDCNPPCTGCLRCAWCDYGKPCCKRLSPHCGSEAGAETENNSEIAQTRKV
ncbi:hypothetical protein K491DRAFT_679276 [Lophiostoma macrostomum CBS 122681]|uniref:Uncharacterized protein n=1 Tax=Lophiostoma macrostomum CBS 122681 TaxID=1314788 RepID=A0A6A6T4J3_9PLEO|nr:hypothetical protein K491DRAFT_679276 [Lophiostoma macrostomum CBS 122681]